MGLAHHGPLPWGSPSHPVYDRLGGEGFHVSHALILTILQTLV